LSSNIHCIGATMKRKIAIGMGLGLIIIIVALALIYYLLPGVVSKMAVAAGRHAAGLTEKAVQVDNHRIVYVEGGKGEVILLVHGYAADKDNWMQFARFLTPKYHVIALDLAGFGESSRLPEAGYDIQRQVERLNRFAEVLKLERFHVAGNSMGGAIAGIYGAQYPQKVMSLALLAPAGIKSPEKSELTKMLEKGVNPLLISYADDYDRMLKMVFVQVPVIPSPVKKEMAARAIRNRVFNEKIMDDMLKKPLMLEPFLSDIQAPTLILWGDRDQLLHLSSVPILERGIKNHQIVIMKDCGHLPMLERPAETANYYLKFLQHLPQE
jgi:abhydrolase domain-containing protein 6